MDETWDLIESVSEGSPTYSFIGALYDVVGVASDVELLRLIWDPSMTCMYIGSINESWSTRIYSLTRGLCYALHVQRNTMLVSS